jgi:thioredoxin reductase
VVKKAGLLIQFSEKMEEIIQEENGFTVRTNKATYRTTNVLLAIGRRGTPRKLGAKGEDHPKVVYKLLDPEQYRGMHVLVVGGGDSALEAALDLCEEPGTKVTLSYRSEAFSRVKPKNRQRLDQAVIARKIRVELQSTVQEITQDQVILKKDDQRIELKNEAVIVCAGGELPIPMLKKIGIKVESRYGT